MISCPTHLRIEAPPHLTFPFQPLHNRAAYHPSPSNSPTLSSLPDLDLLAHSIECEGLPVTPRFQLFHLACAPAPSHPHHPPCLHAMVFAMLIDSIEIRSASVGTTTGRCIQGVGWAGGSPQQQPPAPQMQALPESGAIGRAPAAAAARPPLPPAAAAAAPAPLPARAAGPARAQPSPPPRAATPAGHSREAARGRREHVGGYCSGALAHCCTAILHQAQQAGRAGLKEGAAPFHRALQPLGERQAGHARQNKSCRKTKPYEGRTLRKTRPRSSAYGTAP